MLDDEALALQVASSCERLGLLSLAASEASRTVPSVSRTRAVVVHDSGRRRAAAWALLVGAAVLLIGVTVWQAKRASQDEVMSELAANWIAIDSFSKPDIVEFSSSPGEFVLASDRSGVAGIDSTESLESWNAEQSDWLVEAAREFYLANDEGGAH